MIRIFILNINEIDFKQSDKSQYKQWSRINATSLFQFDDYVWAYIVLKLIQMPLAFSKVESLINFLQMFKLH